MLTRDQIDDHDLEDFVASVLGTHDTYGAGFFHRTNDRSVVNVFIIVANGLGNKLQFVLDLQLFLLFVIDLTLGFHRADAQTNIQKIIILCGTVKQRFGERIQIGFFLYFGNIDIVEQKLFVVSVAFDLDALLCDIVRIDLGTLCQPFLIVLLALAHIQHRCDNRHYCRDTAENNHHRAAHRRHRACGDQHAERRQKR